MNAIALYARPLPGFSERVATTLRTLRQAAAEHPGAIVQATSLGAEDMVVTDLVARHGLPIAVATLDTDLLHPETLQLLDRVRQHYGLSIDSYRAPASETLRFVERHGAQAMFQSVALRKACCALRKLEPLQRLLQGRSAWVTGLRREQSDARAEVPEVEVGSDGRVKFNVLADWRWADVWHYLQQHGVPYNALHDQFHPSIGCQPCTRAVAVGEDFRAGRWWWEESVKECGLHAHANPSPAVSTP